MSENRYCIKVFDDLYDPELIDAWHFLQKEYDVYPQVYYEWIEPWWRFNKKNKRLHIITVIHNDEIVGIAPFCIEKKYGFNTLTTIPIHFSDFYEIICKKGFEEIIFEKIIDYCLSYKKWNYVYFDKINSSYYLYQELMLKSLIAEKKSEIIITDLDFKNFETFLNDIPRKQRGEYNRRIRRFKEEGNLDFMFLQRSEQYDLYENSMKEVTKKRWNTPETKIESIFKYRREVFSNLFAVRKGIGFLLLYNEKLVAFSLGFIHNNTYFNFKLSYDPEFSKYGVGKLVTGMAIEYLINNDIHKFNHGGGEYSYKEKWFNNKIESANYSFYLKPSNLMLSAYVKGLNISKSIIKKILRK